jgi:hypothetical protein
MSQPLLIRPKPKDLGDGFMVRRALPAIEARSVGPFIFLDEMGPVMFAPGQGLDVRPHPHIGLATVTYLFEGAIEHRDSLGTVQVIRPGDVNWMTAGRGIVHSERSPSPRQGSRVHGIQFWVALPAADEETDPAFHHHPATSLPKWMDGDSAFTLICGSAFGRTAPVKTFAPMFYVDAALAPGAAVDLDVGHEERAIYVTEGAVTLGDLVVQAGELAVLAHGARTIAAAPPIEAARFIAFGGAPLDGPRKLWWNFVSSRPERLEQAKRAWAAQEMGLVPGEMEFIPLPDR